MSATEAPLPTSPLVAALAATLDPNVWPRTEDSLVVTEHVAADGAAIVLKRRVSYGTPERMCARFENELAAYTALAGRMRTGDCVPGVVGVADTWCCGRVLALQKVGKAVRRARDGTLVVGEEDVEEAAETGVREAAEESLARLHAEGWVHGEVELRNLRVERGAEGWRAWWIDLSCARVGGEACMRAEREQCAELFQGGFRECEELDDWVELCETLARRRLWEMWPLPENANIVEGDEDEDEE